jgi:uncharacterized protein (TIGR04255 family)
VPHFGAFWSRIESEFPEVAHAPQIISPGEGPLVSDDGIMLPRVWYVSADKVRLLQLQQNRFHFNWRKADTQAEYVRFSAIRAVQPLTNELTYTNQFGVKGKTAFDLADQTLRDSVWCRDTRFLSTPSAIAHSYVFNVPDEVGELTVAITTGKRADEATGVLKVDLTVRGKHSERHALGPWALKAHDFLVEAFKDMTTPAMHKRWGLRNV